MYLDVVNKCNIFLLVLLLRMLRNSVKLYILVIFALLMLIGVWKWIIADQNETCYEILGVDVNANRNEIQLAFKTKAMQVWKSKPDLKEIDKSKFKFVWECFNVLSNDNKRSIYDSNGHNITSIQLPQFDQHLFDAMLRPGRTDKYPKYTPIIDKGSKTDL